MLACQAALIPNPDPDPKPRLDALERGTPFVWSSLLLTNGIGPPGLLLYVPQHVLRLGRT